MANLSFYYSNLKESCIVFFFMQVRRRSARLALQLPVGGRHGNAHTPALDAGFADWEGRVAGAFGWGDFGRKLENLSAPANTQRCAATDGSTNPGRATDGSSGVLASAFHNLPQGHLEFLIPAQRNPSRKPQPPTPHQPANPATPLPQKKQSHPCPAFSSPHLNSGTPQ